MKPQGSEPSFSGNNIPFFPAYREGGTDYEGYEQEGEVRGPLVAFGAGGTQTTIKIAIEGISIEVAGAVQHAYLPSSPLRRGVATNAARRNRSHRNDVLFQQTEEATAFIARRNLQATVDVALELIKDLIPGITKLRSAVRSDPEMGEEWVSIDVEVKAGVDAVLNADRKLVEQWIEKVPIEVSDLVRISYKFAD
jgi:hypothetical protein